MKAAFAQSILDRSNGAFDEVIDIVGWRGSEAPRRRFGRRRLLHGLPPADGTEDAAAWLVQICGTGVGRADGRRRRRKLPDHSAGSGYACSPP